MDRKCIPCDSLIPPFVYHCSSCQRCVVMMDHHCPWINNCVGLYTQKLFFLFNTYAVITFSFSLILIVKQFNRDIFCSITESCKIKDWTAYILASISLITAALIFTLIVLVDQMVIIANRYSVIERVRLYSNRLGKKVKKRGYENYQFTFGGPFSLGWFFPFPPKRTHTVESLYK